MQNFIAASIIVFFIGLKDDILLISPTKKFLAQLLAVFLLTYQGHFQLTTLQGLFGINQLHPMVATVFTYLTMLVIINAFNLIDGVDGLAGMLGVVTGLFFALSFLIAGDIPYAILAFSLVFGLLGFLVYNFSPARVFMGDTGSLFLGLVFSVLAVRFIKTDSLLLSRLKITETGALAFAALFVPLMDTLRVFSIRIYKGLSPFDRDVNHVHHLLLNKGMSHRRVAFVLTIMSLAYLTLAYFLQPFGINVIIGSLFVAGILFARLLSIKKPNRRKKDDFKADASTASFLDKRCLDSSEIKN